MAKYDKYNVASLVKKITGIYVTVREIWRI